MPETITAPIPRAIRLHTPSDFFSRCSGCSEAAIRASMLLVRSRELIGSYNLQPTTHPRERQRTYRLRCPFVIFFTRFFMDPRATPEARLGLGAAFLRWARFNFFRSALSVIFLVFILP